MTHHATPEAPFTSRRRHPLLSCLLLLAILHVTSPALAALPSLHHPTTSARPIASITSRAQALLRLSPEELMRDLLTSPATTPETLLAGLLDTIGLALATVEVEPAHPSDALWVLPHRRHWPTNDAGIPIVTTTQLDEISHIITAKRDLDWIYDRYKTNDATLQTLNPNLDLMSLEVDDEIVVWRRHDDAVAYGRGTPNRGRLIEGEPLVPASKYVILHRHRAYGTYYITSHLKDMFDAYALRFPEAQPVIIGDLSYRTGRHIQPHLSHQSGRDVDITYPRHDEPRNYLKFHYIKRANLDAHRTLWLVQQMAASGYVEKIFMDYWVQRKVYQEAMNQGAPQEWLDAVFQYPRWGGEALIERARGHDDHMHVRYFCQRPDTHCVTEE